MDTDCASLSTRNTAEQCLKGEREDMKKISEDREVLKQHFIVIEEKGRDKKDRLS